MLQYKKKVLHISITRFMAYRRINARSTKGNSAKKDCYSRDQRDLYRERSGGAHKAPQNELLQFFRWEDKFPSSDGNR